MEKIRRSYAHNLGNIEAMRQELGLPGDYLVEQVRKIKRSFGGNDGMTSLQGIISISLEGHKMRTHHLNDLLIKIEKSTDGVVSICCRWPLTHEKVDGEIKFYCSKCKEETYLEKIENLDAAKVIVEITGAMKAEDEQLQGFGTRLAKLVESAETRKLIAATGFVPRERSIEVGLGGGKTFKLTQENREVIADLDKLPMFEKKQIMDNLEKRIANARKARATKQAAKEKK